MVRKKWSYGRGFSRLPSSRFVMILMYTLLCTKPPPVNTNPLVIFSDYNTQRGYSHLYVCRPPNPLTISHQPLPSTLERITRPMNINLEPFRNSIEKRNVRKRAVTLNTIVIIIINTKRIIDITRETTVVLYIQVQ